MALYFATGNRGKFAEGQAVLEDVQRLDIDSGASRLRRCLYAVSTVSLTPFYRHPDRAHGCSPRRRGLWVEPGVSAPWHNQNVRRDGGHDKKCHQYEESEKSLVDRFDAALVALLRRGEVQAILRQGA